MSTTMAQTDLFNLEPEVFDLAQTAPLVPSQDMVRARLMHLLEAARSATRMPWPPQRERVNTAIFFQSSNWLPESERESLREQFRRELERLRAAG
jgi:hypothetical protein